MLAIVVKIANMLIKYLGVALTAISYLLPDSPFTLLENSAIAEYLGYINYFLPLDFCIATLELWVAAIAVWYIYQVVMRWAKVVD